MYMTNLVVIMEGTDCSLISSHGFNSEVANIESGVTFAHIISYNYNDVICCVYI